MSILLYESYNPQPRSFARTKDTEKSLVITLAAGKGTVIDAYAFDPATMAHITKAYPGQEIGLYATVRNDGDKDVTWLTGKDKDTGALIPRKDGTPFDYETTLDPGKNMGITHSPVIMPKKNWNLIFEAGHGK